MILHGKIFSDRTNNELVSIFGNFVNRAFVLMHKLCNGRMPPLHKDIITDADRALIEDLQKAKTKVENCIEGYKFRDGLFEVVDLARKGNKYLQDCAPWSLAKTPELQQEQQQKIDNCLHLCLH